MFFLLFRRRYLWNHLWRRSCIWSRFLNMGRGPRIIRCKSGWGNLSPRIRSIWLGVILKHSVQFLVLFVISSEAHLLGEEHHWLANIPSNLSVAPPKVGPCRAWRQIPLWAETELETGNANNKNNKNTTGDLDYRCWAVGLGVRWFCGFDRNDPINIYVDIWSGSEWSCSNLWLG